LENPGWESHIGVYTIIQEIQKEQQEVEVQIERMLRGEQPPKKKKKVIDRENRIMTIINDRENRSIMDFYAELHITFLCNCFN